MKVRYVWGSAMAAALAMGASSAGDLPSREHQQAWTRALDCNARGDQACAKIACNQVLVSTPWIGKYCHAIVSKKDMKVFDADLERVLVAFKESLGGRSITWEPKVAAAEKLKGLDRRNSLTAALDEQVIATFGAGAYIEAREKGRQEVDALQSRAASGAAQDQYALGAAYYDGNVPGLAKNDQLSLQWISRAASQGHVRAQFGMGLIYANGRGVPKDAKQAAIWYRKAAEQGAPDAQFNLARALRLGEGVAKDPSGAVDWYRKAADAGHGAAQNTLGAMYEDGQGLPKDLTLAIGWYGKAAAQSDPFGQTNLGRLSESGTGMPKDHAAAARWYELAVRSKHPPAMRLLGRLLENGWGAPADPARAIRLYEEAGAAGESQAWFNLGYAHAEGKSVPLDGARAIEGVQNFV